MNRRSNKILRELILGNRQNVLELVDKYNLQERTIMGNYLLIQKRNRISAPMRNLSGRIHSIPIIYQKMNVPQYWR